jgi:hypothetical protein
VRARVGATGRVRWIACVTSPAFRSVSHTQRPPPCVGSTPRCLFLGGRGVWALARGERQCGMCMRRCTFGRLRVWRRPRRCRLETAPEGGIGANACFDGWCGRRDAGSHFRYGALSWQPVVGGQRMFSGAPQQNVQVSVPAAAEACWAPTAPHVRVCGEGDIISPPS